MRDLHRGSVRVTIDGDNFAPEAHRFDSDLTSELAAAEQDDPNGFFRPRRAHAHADTIPA
jgi:hypothetical protein